jgi:two-component system nitrogen regulation response regulator GlnG
VQVKLLRAIEEREVTPVGDTQPRRSDFRVLAATNRSLDELVAQGEFRLDLYYRLGVFHICLPPLRERTEDIPLLATHFLRHATGATAKRLSKAAVAELVSRPWLGNVRELRAAVERAAVVARGDDIEPEHLPPPSPTRPPAPPSIDAEFRQLTAEWVDEQWRQKPSDAGPVDLYERFLRVSEPALLKSILARCGENRAAAARILGIHRATLRQKLRDNALDDPRAGDI